MNKLIFALSIFLFSASAFSADIPKDKLGSYKAAVKYALSKVNLNCTISPANFTWRDGSTNASNLKGIIDLANTATLNENGSQPILTFNSQIGEYGYETSITTSTDYKTIIAIDFVSFKTSMQEVNLGTIVNPKIVNEEGRDIEVTAACK